LKTLNKASQKEADQTFKKLMSHLSLHGFIVRREELKRGYGWKAMSGSCRKESDNLVFVDRRLPITEQINFLQSKILEFGLPKLEAAEINL